MFLKGRLNNITKSDLTVFCLHLFFRLVVLLVFSLIPCMAFLTFLSFVQYFVILNTIIVVVVIILR